MEDRLSGLRSIISLRPRRGVGHQDRVLRRDADWQGHADQRNNAKLDSEKRQRQHDACETTRTSHAERINDQARGFIAAERPGVLANGDGDEDARGQRRTAPNCA